jgi:CRP-like cAMP-binding protein
VGSFASADAGRSGLPRTKGDEMSRASTLPPPPEAPISRYQNRILAALPASEIKHLAPHLTHVVLDVREMLADGQAEYGYFLEEGLASVVITQQSGDTTEVGVVGIDGVVGVPILLGVNSTPGRTYVQVAGSGYRVPAERLKEAFERSGELRPLLQRYIQAFMVQSAHNSACNRHHEIAQRLARWVLTCHDRIQSDRMPLTHEFLSNMLGAPRATVTLAAGQLQKAGFIEYTRGHVTITNRTELEYAACECYRVVRDEFRRLALL